MRRALACAVLAWIAFPALASAQFYVRRDVPRSGSVEAGGGIVWTGAFDQGSASAEETRNSTTDPAPFVLFTAKSRTQSVTGAQARVGMYLTREVSVEAGLEYGRPTLDTQVGDDAELAETVVATERLTRIVVDGSAVVHLSGLSFHRGAGMPFLRAGIGYLRELHEKNEVIETGNEYHVGGGVKVWFGQGKHRVGFRADAGLSFRKGGADTPDTKRTVPTTAASLMYLF